MERRIKAFSGPKMMFNSTLYLAGMQPCLVQKCQWTSKHTWLLPESNNCLEIPHHVKGTHYFCDKVYVFYVCLSKFFTIFLCFMMQLATLTGHTYRVLYLAISPDGQVLHFSIHLFLFPDYQVSMTMTKKMFFCILIFIIYAIFLVVMSLIVSDYCNWSWRWNT